MQKKILLILMISFICLATMGLTLIWPITKGWSQQHSRVSPEELLPFRDLPSTSSLPIINLEQQKDGSDASKTRSPFGDSFNHVRDSVKHGFQHTISHFPSVYLQFHIALGAMAVWDCSIRMKDNPMACEEFEHSLTDPLSFLSFFLFMVSHHSTAHFLQQMDFFQVANGVVHPTRQGRLRQLFKQSVPGYAGLAAGMIVSHIAIDFLTDPNIQYLARHLFSLKRNNYEKDLFENAWNATGQRWFQEDGFLRWKGYAPDVISVLLAVTASSATTGFMRGGLSSVMQLLQKKGVVDIGRVGPSSATIMGWNGGGFGVITNPKHYMFGIGAKKYSLSFVGNISRMNWITGIAHMILFFSWNDYIQPHVKRAWDSGRIIHQIRYQESAILHHLTSGYQTAPVEIPPTENLANNKPFFASLLDTFSDLFNFNRTKDRLEAIRENNNHFQNGQDILFDFLNPQQTEGLNTSISHASVLTNVASYQNNINSFPVLTTLTDDPFREGQEQKRRGDFLLEHITNLNVAANDYRNFLNKFNMTQASWTAFLQPAEAYYRSTYRFYKHIIEFAEQLSFQEEEYYLHRPFSGSQSKGMLDALYFNSRPLNISKDISFERLYLESQLLQYGLSPSFIHVLSDQTDEVLQWILRRFVAYGTDEEDRLLATYLNEGFDISKIYAFEKFDFQVRLEALSRGIAQKFLENSNYFTSTDQIYDFIQEVDESPNRDILILATEYFSRSYILNNKHNPEKLMAEINDRIQEADEGIAQEESKDITKELPNIVENGSIYFDKGYYPGANSNFPSPSSNLRSEKREHGIDYFSTVEKLLIDLVCGPSIFDVQLFERNNLLVGEGALNFNAPRLWAERPSFCSGLNQIQNIHHPFTVWENGQRVHYHHLLDYVSRNINSQASFVQNVEVFDRFWKRHITSVQQVVFDDYKNTQWKIYSEELRQIYNRTDYKDHFDFSSPANVFRVHHRIDHKPYAQGIHQFEKDFTRYHLQLLISVLPTQQDKAFLDKEIYPLLQRLRTLSLYPGRPFDERDPYWAEVASNVASQADNPLANFIMEENRYMQNILFMQSVIQNIQQKINMYLQQRQTSEDIHNLYVREVTTKVLENINQSIIYANTMEVYNSREPRL